MSQHAVPRSPASVPPRVRLPGVAIALLIVAAVLLVLGMLTILGTSSRSFFENAPTQASLGAILLVVGTVSLVGGLVLVGLRAIAQQHLDVLLHTSSDSR